MPNAVASGTGGREEPEVDAHRGPLIGRQRRDVRREPVVGGAVATPLVAAG